MALWKSFFSGAKARLVGVVFASFGDLPRPNASPYVYTWPLRETPAIGARVFVRGGDGREAQAVVVHVDAPLPNGFRRSELSNVLRLATAADLAKGEETARKKTEQATADLEAWLVLMRRAAGLPLRGRARQRVPVGYPAVPPADGDADRDRANEYGRAWFRAAKRAEELGHDPNDAKRFKSLAYRWFAIRDRI